jgi:hypothetical protein
MNLGTLRSHFIALLNRSDITNTLADTFLDQGIARIQRQLRIPSMEKQQIYSISAQTGSLTIPNDFLEPIDLYADNHYLDRITFRDMASYKHNTYTGVPHFFSREGGKYLIFPEPTSGSVILNYYSQFPAMTSDSDENILAQVASDLIIYGALTFAADYFLDERAPVYEEKFLTFLTEVQEQANEQEMSGSLQTIRPATEYGAY